MYNYMYLITTDLLLESFPDNFRPAKDPVGTFLLNSDKCVLTGTGVHSLVGALPHAPGVHSLVGGLRQVFSWSSSSGKLKQNKHIHVKSKRLMMIFILIYFRIQVIHNILSWKLIQTNQHCTLSYPIKQLIWVCVSQWLVFHIKLAIFQLNHGESKLHLMRWWCTFCTRPTHIKSTSSPWVDILFHPDTLSKFQANQSLLLFLNVASSKYQLIIVFGLTQSRTHNLPHSKRAC
jgi:hypothetical protein